MKLSIKRTECVIILLSAIFIITGIYARASAYAILYDNEYQKSTSCVGRGSQGFAYEGNSESCSQYHVRYIMYVGPTSGNCGMELTHEDCGPGETFGPSYAGCSSTYTVGKVTMYGNLPNNPQNQCIASCSISSW